MIVGVDVSSKRIDLAWLENGKPQRWHQELAKGHLIDRLRSIEMQWPGRQFANRESAFDVTDIAIEYPFGRGNAIAALMATVGVITKQAPPWARVAWPSSQEVRAAIGARNTKESAHSALQGMHWSSSQWVEFAGWDEHELDALTTCIGWTKILQAQDES